MAVTFGVLGSTCDEVRDALRTLCEQLGLQTTTLPVQVPGREQWIARAAAPVDEQES